jgi:hypothetical protein
MLKNIEAKIKNVNKDVPLIFSFTIINKGKWQWEKKNYIL